MSIRLRLTAWYAGILAVTLVLFGVAIYGLVHYNTYAEVEHKIQGQAQNILQKLRLSQGLDLYLDPQQASKVEDAQIYVQIYNYTNHVLQQSTNLLNSGMKFPIPDMKDVEKSQGFHRIEVSKYPFLMYQHSITYQGQLIGVLQVAMFTGSEDKLLNRLQNILVYGSVVMLFIATTFGLFLARKSMRPIGKVIEAANQIQKGTDLSVRIDYDGPHDEIGQLIDTVNNMFSRMEGFYKDLEDAYAAQRRFVSDASHELRTPLTTIRGNVDLLKKVWNSESSEGQKLDDETMRQLSIEAVSDIADEAKRMSRLVNDMLSLARADAGHTFEKEPIALKPLVEEVARRSQFLPHTADWVVGDLDVLNGIYVNGNKDYLQQMLFIFVENAFKYTPEGHVNLDVILYENQVGIRIADSGIGMNKDEVPYIFDRFYRADESRGVTQGTGLGLSIAKWIIDEHGGSVEVVTKLGEGTTFIVWLPVVFNPPLE
ncbi:HAMP domain-containing sensor histidine kinase [Paenibacillus sediminis]|uniref:histidine kinase n=1 Tax=Paenibacillus sediminis TaxID=664909 RepID=A0ABS4H7W7_9BACL|nr:HAMP domain-containing sensor histidine kinase [Paenibacillus sediminis]MBP1938625.1 signal transduction histidine kinase [Paenibacillus sediminis]